MTPRLRLSADAALEPVTIEEARAYARVDATDEDALTINLIAAARRRIERETGLALINQTWVAVFERWPPDSGITDQWWDGVREGAIGSVLGDGAKSLLNIPKRPFWSLTSIKYKDSTGVLQTVSSSVYHVTIANDMARIGRVPGQVWPPLVNYWPGAIEVTFVAGYGDTVQDVPEDLRTAILMLTKHWFDNREAVVTGTISTKVPVHVEDIIRGYRPMRMR